jgi:hypothetical protein
MCASCSNDDDVSVSQEEEETEEVGFYNLRVGNTWTYEYFKREQLNDASSEFVTTGTIEEREIIGMSEVNDETIYTFRVISNFGENDFFSEFDEEIETYQVKDSLGFLVQIDQGIIFSSESNEEYLIRSEGFGDIFGVLLDSPENIGVPSGEFTCIVNEAFAQDQLSGEIFPGRNNRLVTEGVGEILARISFVSNPIHAVERRLISFDFPE